jgi:hypothetical protein
MGLQMVNACKGQMPGKSYSLGGIEADQKGTGQPRTAGHRHSVDFIPALTGPFESLLDNRDNRQNVLAGSNLGHYASIPGMNLDLGTYDVRKDMPAVTDYSSSRFITRGFYAKDNHGDHYITGSDLSCIT